MKKLNRKGFTLVELLAVIVILAIVVGITLVTVLPTIKKTRNEAFMTSADTAADYYDKNYQLYAIGERDSVFYTDSSYNSCLNAYDSVENEYNNFCRVNYRNAGLKEDNYADGKFVIDTVTGRVCIMLQKSSDSNGEFYDAEGNDPNYKGNGIAFSSSCTEGQISYLRSHLGE